MYVHHWPGQTADPHRTHSPAREICNRHNYPLLPRGVCNKVGTKTVGWKVLRSEGSWETQVEASLQGGGTLHPCPLPSQEPCTHRPPQPLVIGPCLVLSSLKRSPSNPTLHKECVAPREGGLGMHLLCGRGRMLKAALQADWAPQSSAPPHLQVHVELPPPQSLLLWSGSRGPQCIWAFPSNTRYPLRGMEG